MVIQLFVMLVLSRKHLDRNDVTIQINGAVDCSNTLICVECIALYSCPMTAALGHVKNQNALYNEIYIKRKPQNDRTAAQVRTISVSHRLLMCHISHKN